MCLIADRVDALLAGKGYDADAIRHELANADIEAVIPAKSNRRNPAPHDQVKYRWRNRIERLFNNSRTGVVSLPAATRPPNLHRLRGPRLSITVAALCPRA